MRYGRGKQHTDYDALRSGLKGVFESVVWTTSSLCGYSIAIPYGIGCGLAGGEWRVVRPMIDEIFQNYDVSIYKLGG